MDLFKGLLLVILLIICGARMEKSNAFIHVHEMALNSSKTMSLTPHEDWAVAYNHNGSYIAASALLYLWSPHVEPNECTLNFVALGISNGSPISLTNAIFIGWAVLPTMYEDYRTRLFVGAINQDSGISCINEECGQVFVRLSERSYVGSPFAQVSEFGNPDKQKAMKIRIVQVKTEKRWIIYLEGELFGYFDFKVIGMVVANTVAWGGKVQQTISAPTRTQMGSGQFAEEGINFSGFIDNAVVRTEDSLIDIAEEPTDILLTRPQCFNLTNLGPVSPGVGYGFLYGGPGSFDSRCA